MLTKNGYIINLEKIGSEDLGYISVAEYAKQIPFTINRVYWTYHTPPDIERGNHAHVGLHQVLIAVNGRLVITLENQVGEISTFELDHPSKGLYIPPGYWRTIRFLDNAVLLCLASAHYDESDYIRDYTEFKTAKNA